VIAAVLLDGDLPKAETWRFSPRDRLYYTREKDHIALIDADRTFCGRAVNPNGYPCPAEPFDPVANYSCKRCVAALRKRGPVLCWRRSSFYDVGAWVRREAVLLDGCERQR
jgi:hypothetical protein